MRRMIRPLICLAVMAVHMAHSPISANEATETRPSSNVEETSPSSNNLISDLEISPSKNETTSTKNITEEKPKEPETQHNPVQDLQYDFNPDLFLFPEKHPYMMPTKKNELNVEIDGFIEQKFSMRDYNPKSILDHRWDAIRKDPIYNKLPKDVLVGDPKFDTRLKFEIQGELESGLKLYYDIEQEPDFPGKYDIRIEWKTSDLTVGQYGTDWKTGSFINTTKALDGIRFRHQDDNWRVKVATGKLRSDPKSFISQGNGGKKYKLGNKFILEDSVKVFINNIQQSGDTFTINYFEGTITFKENITINDQIKVIYEFTNPIEDFIPILSRKNFNAAEFEYTEKTPPKLTKIKKSESEKIKPYGAIIKQMEAIYIENHTTLDASGNVTPSITYEAPNQTDGYGHIQLKHKHIELGSLYIDRNGFPLKGKDYYVKTREGTVHFNDVAFTPSDNLYITYDYLITKKQTESLIGSDSTGPYKLKNNHLIKNSTTIRVKGKVLAPFHDYSIDEREGKITFKYPIAYPELIIVDYEFSETELEEHSLAESPFHVAMTYLQETANPIDEELELITATESYTVTNNGRVFLDHYPLLPSKSMSIKIDGNKEVTSSITVIDAYTGEVELTDHTSDGNHTLDIKYTYNKSLKTSFIFQGRDGVGTSATNPYIDGEHFVLPDTPVQYKGVLHIDLYTGGKAINLEEGKDFVVDYGENGKTIKLHFLTNADNRASILTDYPSSADRITLVYNYTPEYSPNQGSVNQTTVGLAASSKLTNEIKIFGELAAAANNYSRPRLDGSFESVGNGVDNHAYFLGKTNLVEDTETVYLNGVVQTKDLDYFINNVGGTITFRNQTPQQSDVILVNFSYYDNSGTTVLSDSANFIPAIKLGASYVTHNLVVASNVASIGKGFKPLSPIKESAGSLLFDTEAKWTPNKGDAVFVRYQREQINKGNSGYNDIILNKDELNAKSTWEMFDGWVNTKQSFNFVKNEQPPIGGTTTANNQYAVDDRTLAYNGSMRIGNHKFHSDLAFGVSNSETDTREKLESVIKDTSSFKWSSGLEFDKLGLLGSFNVNPAITLENENINNKKNDTSGYKAQRDIHITSGWRPLRNLNSSFTFSELNIENKAESESTANINNVYNYSSSVYYSPFRWINLSYANSQSEDVSPLVNQKGKRSQNNNYGIRKFSPYKFGQFVGLTNIIPFFGQIRNATMSYNYGKGNTSENDELKHSNRNNESLSIENLEVIPGVKFKPIKFDRSFSHTDSLVGTSTSSSNSSQRVYRSSSYGVQVKPKYPILKMFTYELNETLKFEENVSSQNISVTTDNVTTRLSPSYKKSQMLEFKPGPMVLPVFGMFNINFGTFSGKFTETIDEKINSTNVTGEDPKVSRDNQWNIDREITLSANPMNLIPLTGSITSKNVHYSRNINSNDPETTFRHNLNYRISTPFSPIPFIKTKALFSSEYMNQYISPDLYVSRNDIIAAKDAANGNIFKGFLERRTSLYSLSASFKPFDFIGFQGNAQYSIIDQTSAPTVNVETVTKFTQKKGSAGLTLFPLPGLKIGSNYQLSITNNQQGYAIKTDLSYSMNPHENFKITIGYDRKDNWGQNLNSLNQQTSLQGEGDDIALEVVSVDNTVETGSLKIDINIPLPELPHAENFVVTGEGYIKKITDRLDDTSDLQNSYDITGLIIKGTVNF